VIVVGVDIGGTSVKAVVLTPDAPPRRAGSALYARPTLDALRAAVRDAVGDLPASAPVAVGLCAPGLYDESRGVIAYAANLPALADAPLQPFILEALGLDPRRLTAPLRPVSDAFAAGYDYWATHRPEGRLLALSLGTGIGATVLDDGVPLRVSGTSPGHLGQIDVGIADERGVIPIGPDGGRGTLEAYLGLPALRASNAAAPGTTAIFLADGGIELRALARALRIAHALYRPRHIRLLGGVGLALGPNLRALRALVDSDLTRLAIPGWTLEIGDSPFHAAGGAARLATPTADRL